MTTHPNRSRAAGPASNPAPADIRAAREAAGLTQTQAAQLLHGTLRSWQMWEAGERRLHPALWAFFLLRTSQHPSARLIGDPGAI